MFQNYFYNFLLLLHYWKKYLLYHRLHYFCEYYFHNLIVVHIMPNQLFREDENKMKHFEGNLFEPIVFNDSVKEFLRKRAENKVLNGDF